MRRTLHMILLATALSIASIVNALPHGDDEDMQMDGGMDMSDMGMPHSTQPVPQPTLYSPISTSDAPMSYFAYGKHSDTIIAHIALMVLAWCFVLPAGKAIHKSLFLLLCCSQVLTAEIMPQVSCLVLRDPALPCPRSFFSYSSTRLGCC